MTDQNQVVKKEGEEANQDSEMADGDVDGDDNDDDDDDDDGEEGDDGDDGDGDESGDGQQRETTEGIDAQDKEMTDAPPEASESPAIVPASAIPASAAPAVTTTEPVAEAVDVPMKEEGTTPERAAPPNPLTLAPPSAGLASETPKVEGSPLKNVLMPSPTETKAPGNEDITMGDGQSPVKSPAEDSTLAEPPSTVVGQRPEGDVEAEVPPLEPQPLVDEALLPPPPEQVGNIASPKASPKEEIAQDKLSDKVSENESHAKEEVAPGEEAIPERPPLPTHEDSTLTVATQDSIKPDDSASAVVPVAPSEADTALVPEAASVLDEPVAEPPVADAMELDSGPVSVENPVPTIEKAAEKPDEAIPQSSGEPATKRPISGSPAPAPEPDLLGGLIGELDREAASNATTPPAQTKEPSQELLNTPTPPDAEIEQPPAPYASVQPTATATATDIAIATASPILLPEQPSIDQAAEGGPEPSTEATIEPAAEPIVEPVVETAPIVGEAAAQPTAEPTVEPTVEPMAEPLAEPLAEPTAEPTVGASAKPAVEPAVEPTAEPAVELITKTAVSPGTVGESMDASATIAPAAEPPTEPAIEEEQSRVAAPEMETKAETGTPGAGQAE